MADLVTRLLLNSSQFDNNIRQSTQQVQQFQNTARNITGMIGKFAGALGLAMGAGEAFNKVLNSSQTLGDMTASNMAALKSTVDEFFYSLGSGDFTSFFNGLDGIINRAKDAYVAIDQLGNTRISHDYFSAENQAKIAESQYVAKNKFAPLEERVKAFENWKGTLENQKEINQTLQQDIVSYVTKAVESEIGTDMIKVTMDDVRMALKVDVTNPTKREELKERYSNAYGAYTGFDKAKRKELNNATTPERIAAINEQLQDNANKQREAVIVNALLNKLKDEELTALKDNAKQYQTLTSSLSSISREYNETASEFNSANKAVKGFNAVSSLEGYKVYTGTVSTGGTVKKKVEVVPKEGSIAKLDAEIALKKKELNLVISDTDRVRINKELEALTEKVRVIEFQYKYPDAPTGKLDDRRGGLALLAKKPQMPTKLEISKKDVKVNNEYAESLGAVASMMGAITNMTSEGAATWLQWSATLLGAVATAIPAIQALTNAKKGEAIGNAVASATQTPVVGWLLAGAAVASVIAAFASMPSFSTGGIFAGNSTIGDMNLARVNSGEMILNNRQQKNLFNLLNGNGTSVAGGEVTFKIQGKELVGVLSNYNNRINKVK